MTLFLVDNCIQEDEYEQSPDLCSVNQNTEFININFQDAYGRDFMHSSQKK